MYRPTTRGLPMQIYLFALYGVLYFYFVYFITGTAGKENWEGCRGQRFYIYIFVVLFLVIYGVCFIVRRTSMRECPV